MNTQAKHIHHVTPPQDRIPLQQLVAFGFGGIIPIALFNIAGQLMVLIGNISLGLSAFWLGVIMIIPRLWDAVSDPVVGHISDNTRTRWGRRRPYLLIGGISVAVSFVLMWWIPQGAAVQAWFPTEAAFQWFQLGYILFWLLVFFTACTIFEIPHGALGMEMSPDYHERTRLFSAKSFLGNLFAMSTPWLFALANMEVFKGSGGNEADGMRYVSMLIAAILIPLSFWWFFSLREPGFKIAAKQEKPPFWKDMKHTASNRTFLRLVVIIFTLAMGFNFVALFGYYIPIFYIFEGDKSAASTLLGINGTIWAVTGLIAVFPLNWLSANLGKRNTLIIAIALMCLAQLSKIVCYDPHHPYLIIIPTILLSSGMLFFFTLGASMVGDICDEDDLNTGHRSEGSYYSVFWWFIKMGTAFAGFVTGLLLMFTQFDETQVTKVDDLQGRISQIHAELETWQGYDEKTSLLKAQSTVATAVDAARMASAELRTHLESKSRETINSAEHYAGLIRKLSSVDNILAQLEAQSSQFPPDRASFSKALSVLEKEMVPLTLQAPYTLFWMRAVEIGLPLLLSLVSIFFALRYSLSEERCYEIKAALKERNKKRLDQSDSRYPDYIS